MADYSCKDFFSIIIVAESLCRNVILMITVTSTNGYTIYKYKLK